MTEIAPLTLDTYPLIRSGKVRDIYDAGDRLLLVASDRLSAFDVILPTPIPGKGAILTGVSALWFAHTQHIMPNHLITTDVSNLDLSPVEQEALAGRTMVAKRADRIDVECVVRGYLAGSGYKEYCDNATLAGEALPDGLRRADQLPEPRFTPAIKNDDGHDVNISRAQLADIVGADLAGRLETLSFGLYEFAQSKMAEVGIVLADTKFEFGFVNNELTLIDEMLTPDSSRYWEADAIVSGEEPASFDKQIVRNWLETQEWPKTPPGPEIPLEVVRQTRGRYQALYDAVQNAFSKG